MKRAAIGSMIAVLVASPAAIAQVQRLAEPPARARAIVGIELGGGSQFGRSRGTMAEGAHSPFSLGVALAGEYHLAHRWWLAGTFGVSQWVDGASVEAGYVYRRLGLGVAPRFEVRRWPGWLVTTTLDLALPIGLSKPSATVPQRRAFSEQVDNAWGWYAGGTVGVTVMFHVSRSPTGPSIGLRAGAGYLRHTNGRRTTYTPTDPAQATVVEDIDVVDNDLLVTAAFVTSF